MGQVVFAILSPRFTRTHYESRIFATTGIRFDGSDLHKLNEGAHYFGQTMIGWTKFPNFQSDLIEFATLPAETGINMHMQERQNIILALATKEPIEFKKLEGAKDFLQTEMDEYSSKTNTKFILTNLDYEQTEIKRSYTFGALFTLLLSVAIGLAILFIRQEFFPPKLKL